MFRQAILSLAAVAVVFASLDPVSAGCHGSSRGYSRPTYQAQRAAAPVRYDLPVYCICTPDEQGNFQVRGVTNDRNQAARTTEVLKANGIQAWAMLMDFKAPARAGGLTMANGEAAIAVAYNIGAGRTRAAAIGGSGAAEALAVN